ncbi:MAG: hypothetical protein H6925_04910 [Holosporaceae bacterium]|nr:MAG: hypothetical protein H6925_04910 [Holosporaceae bacterium]
MGACLLTLATAHAATGNERPERPTSARVRKTIHHTEATAKWEMWSTQFKDSPLCTPEEDASDDDYDDASAAPQTPKQKVFAEIETYWASLVKQQLYAQFRAPIMPEDFETDEDKEEALENFQQTLEVYEESIERKALGQAKEAMAGLLISTTRVKHGSSTTSLESDYSESDDGADSLDNFQALKEGLFTLATSVDNLSKST